MHLSEFNNSNNIDSIRSLILIELSKMKKMGLTVQDEAFEIASTIDISRLLQKSANSIATEIMQEAFLLHKSRNIDIDNEF